MTYDLDDVFPDRNPGKTEHYKICNIPTKDKHFSVHLGLARGEEGLIVISTMDSYDEIRLEKETLAALVKEFMTWNNNNLKKK